MKKQVQTAQAPLRSEGPYAWYVLAVLTLAAVFSYTDRQILNLLVDPIRADLRIDDLQISLVQGAAFAFIYSILGLPIGRWADHTNRRNLVAGGVALWSFATALCGLAESYRELFAYRILVGIGEAALAPCALSLISDYFGVKRRGTAISIFIAGMTLGSGLAISLGGLLRGLFESGAMAAAGLAPWRGVMLVLGLFGMLFAALILTIREPRRDMTSHASAEELPTLRQVAAYLFSNRRTFFTLYGAWTVFLLADYGVGAWFPSLMMRSFDYKALDVAGQVGLITIVVGGIATVAGGMLGDWLLRRGWSDAKVRVGLGGFLLALLAAPALLSSSSTVVMLGFTLYTFGGNLGLTAGLTAMQDIVPNRMRGVTTSIQAFLYTAFGLGVGPSLVALVTDGGGNLATAIVTVMMPLLLAALLLIAAGLASYRRLRARQ
jgi:MFS family permease